MEDSKRIYIQCQNCGNISYDIVDDYNIEELFVDGYECWHCGYPVGLNCGQDRNEIDLYVNSNLDNRYF